MTRLHLCTTDQLESGTARRFDIGGHRIALVRIGDAYYAIGDRCTHQDVSLSDGEVDTNNLEIECWKHGSRFSLLTGEALTLPAIKPEPVYHLTRVGSDLFVDLDEPREHAQSFRPVNPHMNTLSQALAELDARGWAVQFEVDGQGIRCVHCHDAAAPPESFKIDHTYRFEGPTDPSDEAILFALTSPCGHRGTLVAAYGPDISPATADAIRRLGGRT